MHMKPTTYSLDVFPTPFLKDVVKTVDPNILAIVIAVSPMGLFLILLNYCLVASKKNWFGFISSKQFKTDF